MRNLLNASAILLPLFFGCADDAAPPIQAAVDEESVPTITFAGTDWRLVGPCDYGDTTRYSLNPRCYTNGEPELRLLELLPRPGQYDVYSRILKVQILASERWVSHGPSMSWDINGSKMTANYELGLMHGVDRAWWPNGQLKVERQWTNGKENGVSRGWHENGRPRYESTKSAGVEISGKAWDENGELLN